jgi:hypothetical protein
MHTRYCLNCDEEFRPEILRCSDCGGDLQDRYEDEGADERPAGEGQVAGEESAGEGEVPVPPDDERLVSSVVDAASLKEAAACLASASVPFRATRLTKGFHLLVRPENASAARAALEREGLDVVYDPQPSAGAEEVVCPACGASVPCGVLECPGCGLVVGAEAARCESCGTPLEPTDVQCPTCHPAGD